MTPRHGNRRHDECQRPGTRESAGIAALSVFANCGIDCRTVAMAHEFVRRRAFVTGPG
jgi:hypothetical protein